MLRRCAISALLLTAALSASARTRPHYGGTLHIEIEGDPWQGNDDLAHRLVFDGLTTLDPSGAVAPALALSWKPSNGEHQWEFRLRPGVHFQDGSLLTTQAAVMSLNLACNGNCPWSALRAVGSSLIFTGDSPLPNLPSLLATDPYRIALTRNADGMPPSEPIGTGPFRVAAASGNTLTLAANESGWQARPFVDQIILTSHRSIRDQWLDLNYGRADLVQVPPEQLRQAQNQHITVFASPPAVLLALEVSNSGALANPMLRAAIALAVDRKAIYNVIYQKQGEVTAGLLPQAVSGYAFLFPADRELSKASEVRGGLNSPPLMLRTEADGAMQLTAQRLALNLRDAGFNVKVTTNAQRPDLVLTRLPICGSDPAEVLSNLLYEAAQMPSLAADTPEALYRVERTVLDQHTIVPLLDLPRAWATGGHLHNFSLRADGTPDLASASVGDTP